MSADVFLIHELAERAKTTIRTIRYYAEEGLLPQPVTQGKYAYYTPEHLNRLELIRRMKDEFLPLRHIKQIMNSLTDEEVRQRLANPAQASQRAAPGAAAGSGALEYISRVMEGQSDYLPQTRAVAPPSSPSPAFHLKASPEPEVNPSPAPLAPPAGQDWQRVPLAEGVELHVRKQPDPDTAQRIQKLIEFAKRLF